MERLDGCKECGFWRDPCGCAYAGDDRIEGCGFETSKRPRDVEAVREAQLRAASKFLEFHREYLKGLAKKGARK